jgi:hypothetical protein
MANFVTGAIDRETSLTMFEQVLHEFGFLPKEELLDRTISNENFLALLKMAKDQKSLPIPTDTGSITGQGSLVDDWQKAVPRLAGIINNRCPVCMQRVQGVYSSMQDFDGRMVPVDPPRCHSCMIKWVEKMMSQPTAPAEKPNFSLDESVVKPLDTAELDFFKQMEKDMEGFKP